MGGTKLRNLIIMIKIEYLIIKRKRKYRKMKKFPFLLFDCLHSKPCTVFKIEKLLYTDVQEQDRSVIDFLLFDSLCPDQGYRATILLSHVQNLLFIFLFFE